jgi:predicted nucleic acid-binding protein
MNVFADTNWLEALYFIPKDDASRNRRDVVERRMRRHSGPLIVSHIVLLEARNVFGRLACAPQSPQWEKLREDFNCRIFVDPMNWEILRQATNRIFEQFSHKVIVGTFDATLIASAQLAGAQELLSFDETLKALASVMGIKVFPELRREGKALVARLAAGRAK